jgi:hypothetical protein
MNHLTMSDRQERERDAAITEVIRDKEQATRAASAEAQARATKVNAEALTRFQARPRSIAEATNDETMALAGVEAARAEVVVAKGMVDDAWAAYSPKIGTSLGPVEKSKLRLEGAERLLQKAELEHEIATRVVYLARQRDFKARAAAAGLEGWKTSHAVDLARLEAMRVEAAAIFARLRSNVAAMNEPVPELRREGYLLDLPAIEHVSVQDVNDTIKAVTHGLTFGVESPATLARRILEDAFEAKYVRSANAERLAFLRQPENVVLHAEKLEACFRAERPGRGYDHFRPGQRPSIFETHAGLHHDPEALFEAAANYVATVKRDAATAEQKRRQSLGVEERFPS